MHNSFAKKLGFIVVGIFSAAIGGYLSLKHNATTDFETLDNKKYSWQALQGQILVVNYFAEWCAPCLKEIPELNKFDQYASNNESVSLFAVSFDALNLEELNKLTEKYDITFPVMKSAPKQAPFPLPKSLPATYIISPQGELVKQLQGEQTSEALQNIVESLSERF